MYLGEKEITVMDPEDLAYFLEVYYTADRVYFMLPSGQMLEITKAKVIDDNKTIVLS